MTENVKDGIDAYRETRQGRTRLILHEVQRGHALPFSERIELIHDAADEIEQIWTEEEADD